MSLYNNYAVILAGGAGSRFWPESRQNMPKQFLDVLGVGKTMLQITYLRFSYIFPKENIYVVTHDSYLNQVKENLPELADENIVCEPSRKNTAAPAAYITYKLHKKNPDANIMISPVDHLIMDERAFERQIFGALDFANKSDNIVVMGIKPTRPDPEYSYIQFRPDDQANPFHSLKTFTEEPGIDLARTFLKSGDFLWNSGIFFWKAQTGIKTFENCLPEINEIFAQAFNILNTPEEEKAMEMFYAQLTNISLNHGILERAQNIYVTPAHFGWRDLGNWSAVYDNIDRDYLGNAILKSENVMIVDASNCMLTAPKDKLVVLQGLDGYIIVDTKDVLLICERNKESQIKGYVAEVRRNKGEKFL